MVSGLPPLDIGRKVTIYSPARTAGQQGLSQTAAGAPRLLGAAALRLGCCSVGPIAAAAGRMLGCCWRLAAGAGASTSQRLAVPCRGAPTACRRPYSACPVLLTGGGPAWKIQHENRGKWVNPLIGWTSTADPLDNVGRQLYFPSKDAAIAYAGAWPRAVCCGSEGRGAGVGRQLHSPSKGAAIACAGATIPACLLACLLASSWVLW